MKKENKCIGLPRRLVLSITYLIDRFNYELQLRLIWSILKIGRIKSGRKGSDKTSPIGNSQLWRAWSVLIPFVIIKDFLLKNIRKFIC